MAAKDDNYDLVCEKHEEFINAYKDMLAQLRSIVSGGEDQSEPEELASDKPAFSEGRTMAVASIVAFCVGIYDGFYGPGTGTFLLLLLTGVARLDVYHAAGTTKAINLTTNAAALAVFLTSGVVVIALGLLGGIFNIAGNYLGANLFTDKGSKIVRPIILVVLVVFAARIILQFAGVL
jgi:uncharacterized membrane protein YfcA